MPAWQFSSWSQDNSDGLILFRMPSQIDLNPPNPQYNPNRTSLRRHVDTRLGSITVSTDLSVQHESATNLPSLPLEIQFQIIDYLPPVDRVCLALACKSLCASVLAAPRLTPATWQRFTDEEAGGRARRYSYFYRLGSRCTPLPESYTLLQRLAHGWIPKHRLRYCWRCHRIMSRDPEFWRRRIVGKKKPKWDVRTSCDKDQWNKMGTKKRMQFLVKTWCEASFEDSSLLCCDGCRDEAYAREINERNATFYGVSRKSPSGDSSMNETQIAYANLISSSVTLPTPAHMADKPAWGPRATINGRPPGPGAITLRPCLVPSRRALEPPLQPSYPIECPTCLEHQLTFTFRLPRKSVIRKFLHDCWYRMWKMVWNTVWFGISVVVGTLTLFWTLVGCLSTVIKAGVLKLRFAIDDLIGYGIQSMSRSGQ